MVVLVAVRVVWLWPARGISLPIGVAAYPLATLEMSLQLLRYRLPVELDGADRRLDRSVVLLCWDGDELRAFDPNGELALNSIGGILRGQPVWEQLVGGCGGARL